MHWHYTSIWTSCWSWAGWDGCAAPLLQNCSLREIHFGRETEISIIASAVRTITAEQSPGVKKVLKQGGIVTLHKPVQGFCSEWSLCRSTSVFTDPRGNLEKRVTFWIHDIIISELFCHIHFQSLPRNWEKLLYGFKFSEYKEKMDNLALKI